MLTLQSACRGETDSGIVPRMLTMSAEKIKPGVEDTFTQFLGQRHLRRTPERYAILRMVLSMPKHFYVETLFEALESYGYHVSLATVYNTIGLLVEAGIVRRHQFNNQQAQYETISDGGMGNHQHLVCLKCGKIKELKDTEITQRLTDRHYQSFFPEYFAVYVYGVCSQCRKTLIRKSRLAESKKN